MRVKLIVALLLAIATLMHGQWLIGAAAQPPAHPASSSGIRILVERMPAETGLDGFLRAARREFRWLDANSDSLLTITDAELHTAMLLPYLQLMSAAGVMSADLDGNGIVTRDEATRSARYGQRGNQSDANREEKTAAQVQQWMAADTDNDGRITLAEALKTYQKPTIRSPGETSIADRVRDALALSSTQDSRVTLADFENATTTLFRAIDANGDGRVSGLEKRDYRLHAENPGSDAQDRAAKQAAHEREVEAARAAEKAEARKDCEMPRASERATVLLLSASAAEALSTTTIGSQDVVVQAGRVIVEPGEYPLYVVIATHSPVIWQFSGAVDRIEHAVLSSQTVIPYGSDSQPIVGATGLAPERVTFARQQNCFKYFHETPSGAAAATTAFVRNDSGKEPSLVSSGRSVATFTIPYGRLETSKKASSNQIVIHQGPGSLQFIGDATGVAIQSGPRDLRREFQREYPAGTAEIDAKDVVSSRPAERYVVLPQQAGLLQLLNSGAISRNRSGEYLIHQKIRFPSGLYGAASEKFLLLRGVPEPDGNPGHSTVISEETGQPIKIR